MWAIKILNGTQKGKIYPLHQGNNVLGRSKSANIRLEDHGVSKNHAQIFVTNDKVIISDLKSSNGTFVNGVQIQNHGLKTGDKVLVNHTIFTVFQLPDNVVFPDKDAPQLNAGPTPQQALAAQQQRAQMQAMTHGNNALAIQAHQDMSLSTEVAPMSQPHGMSAPVQEQKGLARIVEQAEEYIDNVALPPIYKTAEKMEFKYLLLLFTLGFVFIVTLLSAIPLTRVTTESVVTESKRRALTLARNLAKLNRNALAENSEISLSTDFVSRETGVEKALILSAQSGAILAPISQMGRYVKDPFIVSLKNSKSERVDVLDNEMIGASVPVKFYDAEIGDTKTVAYSVILYRMDSIAMDSGRILSLFIQIFLIAAFIAAILFIIQYRLIIHPLGKLNKNLDSALRDGTSNINVPFKLKIFQDLVGNINSALSRVSGQSGDSNQINSLIDKGVEASELVNMFPVPSFAIDPESLRFVAINTLLEGHPLFDSDVQINKGIDELTDKSLFECIKDLLDTAIISPNIKHANILPSTDSDDYEISAKSIIDGNKPSYILFTVMPILEEEDM